MLRVMLMTERSWDASMHSCLKASRTYSTVSRSLPIAWINSPSTCLTFCMVRMACCSAWAMFRSRSISAFSLSFNSFHVALEKATQYGELLVQHVNHYVGSSLCSGLAATAKTGSFRRGNVRKETIGLAWLGNATRFRWVIRWNFATSLRGTSNLLDINNFTIDL